MAQLQRCHLIPALLFPSLFPMIPVNATPLRTRRQSFHPLIHSAALLESELNIAQNTRCLTNSYAIVNRGCDSSLNNPPASSIYSKSLSTDMNIRRMQPPLPPLKIPDCAAKTCENRLSWRASLPLPMAHHAVKKSHNQSWHEPPVSISPQLQVNSLNNRSRRTSSPLLQLSMSPGFDTSDNHSRLESPPLSPGSISLLTPRPEASPTLPGLPMAPPSSLSASPMMADVQLIPVFNWNSKIPGRHYDLPSAYHGIHSGEVRRDHFCFTATETSGSQRNLPSHDSGKTPLDRNYVDSNVFAGMSKLADALPRTSMFGPLFSIMLLLTNGDTREEKL